MARPLRVQYYVAVYHVMARGNHGQPIFKDDKDRERFIETFAEAWAADRLKMGHYSRVSQAVSRVGRKPGKRLAQLCRQLEREVENA